MKISSLSRHKGKSKERGSILFLTLMFLILINLFALAFWKLVPVEMHAAKRHMLETEAYFVSDAGVVDSLAFLEKITGDGNIDNYIASNGVLNGDGHRVLRRSSTINGWTWEAEIIPGPETFGHSDLAAPNPLRVFKIESVATRPGITGNSQKYRQVSAWVRQRSFADYNWNCSEFDDGNPLWLFLNSFTLGGSYRTNGPGLLYTEYIDSSFWSNPKAAIGGEFIFAIGSNHPSLGYVDGVRFSSWGDDKLPYYTSGANAGEPRGDRYSKITAEGRAGVRQSDRVELPLNTDSIAFGAWGGTPPASLTNAQKVFGASSKVDIALNGAVPGSDAPNGIFIDGNVNQIQFSVTNATPTTPAVSNDPDTGENTNPSDDENQIIRVWQGGTNDYVEITHVSGRDFQIPAGATVIGNTHSPGQTLQHDANDGKGYTVIKNGNDNTYAVYNGQTNNAIFVDGDVNGVRGTVKGRRSIGVPTDTGSGTSKDKTIVINGELLYAGTQRGQTPTHSKDMLGLIAYAVRLREQPASAAPTNSSPQLGLMWPRRDATNQSNPLYLYTSIFAGRRNDPKLDTPNATTQGGGFGSMSPSSNSYGQGHMVLLGSITEGIRQHKGTGLTAGNSYAFKLDPNLQEIQPPFFPTLPSFDVISWEEKSVFSY